MEYLFLKRKEVSSTSQRQKNLLFKAVEKHWEEEFVMKGRSNREIDSLIYKNLLYQLEIKKVFLDSELSLKSWVLWLIRTRPIFPMWWIGILNVTWKDCWTGIGWNMPRSCWEPAVAFWKIFRRNVVSLRKALSIQLLKK